MFPGMDPIKMQKMMRDMQKKMAEVETDLKERVVEATAGGGMVKVKVNGMEEIVAVEIEQEVIAGQDKTMLEDLVLAAVNEGIRKAKKLREQEMGRIAGANLGGLV
jgi:DNA-binding YbaB/EbfC family protein